MLGSISGVTLFNANSFRCLRRISDRKSQESRTEDADLAYRRLGMPAVLTSDLTRKRACSGQFPKHAPTVNGDPRPLISHHEPAWLCRDRGVACQKTCGIRAVDHPMIVAEVQRHHGNRFGRIALPDRDGFGARDTKDCNLGRVHDRCEADAAYAAEA